MRAVVFVDRASLSLAGGDLKSPLSIPLPSTIVQDMEVIDEEALIKLITESFEKNKMKAASCIVCFSSSCIFQKEVPEKTTEPETEKLRLEFDESVPFNRVLSKVFTQGKTTRIIGINRDLVNAVRKGVTSKGWTVEGIVPTFALYGDQAVNFSAQVAEQILKHYSSLQQVSFSLESEEAALVDPDERVFNEEHHKPKSNRLFLLVGVFVFLILILVMVYMLQQRSKQTVVRDVTEQPSATSAPIIPSATPTEEPTTIELPPNDTNVIQVLNGSGTPGEADRVKARLEEADFTNIITGNAPTQVSDNTSIVVKPAVPRAYREEISTMIKSLGYSVTVRENDEIENDILITTFQQPE